MAPEQARGDLLNLDRRADVYSLGATMYFLLCGAAPFQGGELDVILQVLNDEPKAPRTRAPAIPEDLDTVAMRCLEKDPNRRYESARALGEDLQRFLDGEPILARKPSWKYRIEKWVRKNRGLTILGAASSAVVLVLGAYGVRTTIKARKQQQYASYFGLEAERAESAIRMASLLPIHDPAPERAMVAKKMESLRALMHRKGSWSEAPGRFALGRGYLALGETEAARKELEAAWKGGFDGPEVSQALGLALAELYQKGVTDAMEDSDLKSRQARLAELNRALLWPAQQQLRRARSLENDRTLYAEALLDLVEGREPDAMEKAERVGAQGPWHVEAPLLVAQVQLIRSFRAYERNHYADSRWSLDQARKAIQGALAMAPSSPQAMDALVRAERQDLNLRYDQAQLRPEDLRAMQGTLDRSALLGSSWAPLLNERASLLMRRAAIGGDLNMDVLPDFDEAIRLLETSRALGEDPETLGLLGKAWALKAEHLMDIRKDPAQACLEAIAAFHRLEALQPMSFRNLYYLADAQLSLGRYQLDRGDSGALPSLRQAAATMDRVLSTQGSPTYLRFGAWIGSFLGEAILISGGDPRPKWKRAAELNRLVLLSDFTDDGLLRNQLDLLLDLIAYDRSRGGRPGPDSLAGLDEAALDRVTVPGVAVVFRERLDVLRRMTGAGLVPSRPIETRKILSEYKAFHDLTRMQADLEQLRGLPPGSATAPSLLREIKSLGTPRQPETIGWRLRTRVDEAQALVARRAASQGF